MQKHFYCIVFSWCALCNTTAMAADSVWEKLQLPKPVRDRNLRGVYFVDAKHGWIVGDEGLCLTTDDGGVTWKQQETGSKATFRCVQFLDAKTGWIGGDSDQNAPDAEITDLLHTFNVNPMKPGSLLHTTDGGKTWKISWIPTNFQIHAIEASANPWIVVGTHSGSKKHLDGDFLRSRTGGSTDSWDLDDVGGRCCRSISALRKIGDKRWIAVGAANRGIGKGNTAEHPLWDKPNCRALYSDDNGETWEFCEGSDGKLDTELFAIAAAKNHAVLAVGDEGVILRSQDAGAMWEKTKSPTKVTLVGVTWCGPVAIAIGGDGSVVAGTDDGKNWKSAPAVQTKELSAIAVAGDSILVVGKQGAAFRAKISELAEPKEKGKRSMP